MSAAVVALDPWAQGGTQSAVAELRREALRAVVRQQQVREQLAAIRMQVCEIERRAARALERGDDLLGRQILARGMFTLKAREALEAELVECRASVARLLQQMTRAEDRAWQAAHPVISWRR
jgi:phage shock protein A